MRKGKRTNANQRTWNDAKFMAKFACSDVGIDHESCVASCDASFIKKKRGKGKSGKKNQREGGSLGAMSSANPQIATCSGANSSEVVCFRLSFPAICTATGSVR